MAGLDILISWSLVMWIHSRVSAALVVCSGPSQVINVSINATSPIQVSWDKDYPFRSVIGPSKLLN